jgi:hypothetical protein
VRTTRFALITLMAASFGLTARALSQDSSKSLNNNFPDIRKNTPAPPLPSGIQPVNSCIEIAFHEEPARPLVIVLDGVRKFSLLDVSEECADFDPSDIKSVTILRDWPGPSFGLIEDGRSIVMIGTGRSHVNCQERSSSQQGVHVECRIDPQGGFVVINHASPRRVRPGDRLTAPMCVDPRDIVSVQKPHISADPRDPIAMERATVVVITLLDHLNYHCSSP